MMIGNPAQHYGWISEAGEKLLFENGLAICKITNDQYKLEEDKCYKL
jgi:hypothetical protein